MAKKPTRNEDEEDDDALTLEAARALDDRLTYNEGDLVILEQGTPAEDKESPEVEAAKNYGGAPDEDEEE